MRILINTALMLILSMTYGGVNVFAETGITDKTIRLGSVLALRGKAKGLGLGMKNGLEAAFKGERVQGRTFELLFENDFYEPSKAIQATNTLIQKNIFLMIGNVGTPTAAVTLPILAKENIPSVGFFTGAGILRPGQGGPIANYRASYIQETAAVIENARMHGVKSEEICAYVQDDKYGDSGLQGIRIALGKANAPQQMLESLDALLQMSGNGESRNNRGLVGFYRRNTTKVLEGYRSLKNWEKKTGYTCKLVITVGAYANIAQFVRNAQKNGENWIISAVSFTGADNFMNDLKRYKSVQKIIMTQVVPLLDSNLPIVKEAKEKLTKKDFGFVSLEGFIVGKMTIEILKNIQGDLTRENFIKQVKATKMNLGGLEIDFTTNGYQGSNLVILSYPTIKDGYQVVSEKVWKTLLQ